MMTITEKTLEGFKGKNRTWPEYCLHLAYDNVELKNEVKKLEAQIMNYREQKDIKELAVDRVVYKTPELKYSFVQRLIEFLIKKLQK